MSTAPRSRTYPNLLPQEGVGGNEEMSGAQQIFEELMPCLADQSGHAEIAKADADSQYKGVVQPLRIDLPRDIVLKIK